MSKKFMKRAAGMLSVGIVALALGAAGAAPTTMASPDATASGLTAKQQKAKKKELKKCNKKRNKAQRNKCKKKVNKKYNKLAKQNKPKPKVAINVGVNDDYFSPSGTTMKKGQAIKWVWNNSNRNAHNVTLVSGPAGLSAKEKYDLSTPNSPAVGYTFGPKVLNRTGTYNFVCSLHSTVMVMQIKVTN